MFGELKSCKFETVFIAYPSFYDESPPKIIQISERFIFQNVPI